MESITTKNFTLDLAYSFASQFIARVAKSAIEDSTLNNLSTDANGLLLNLNEAMHKSNTITLSENIIALDNIFNNDFRSTKYFIKSKTYSNNDEEATNARLLENLLKKEGWSLENFGYSKQQSRAENLLDEKDRVPELKQASIAIGAEPYFDRVRESLNNLTAGIVTRDTFITNQSKLKSDEEWKKLKEVLNNIWAVINVNCLVIKTEPWLQLQAGLQTIIDKNQTLAKQRGSRKTEDVPSEN